MTTPDTEKMNELKHYGFGPEAMKQIKVCAACGARGTAAQLFCRECGQRLPESTLYDAYRHSHRTCRACDAFVPEAAVYCPHCGENTAAVDPQPPHDQNFMT